MTNLTLQEQIDQNRKTVAFDSYDITVRQLHDMIKENQIDIAPEYQRHFVWDEVRQSLLIESILLGIPVPSVFMATNKDSTWEVIDGLQRLTTIVNFIGDTDTIKKISYKPKKLTIQGLEKLSMLNGLTFDNLSHSQQMMFSTRPIRVTVLNDRSDFGVRYDLFERLNTGGVSLSPQEIRNCVFSGEFNEFLKEMSSNENFRKTVKISNKKQDSGSYEELVLKFFAYFESRKLFKHSVRDFLNKYMESKTKQFKNKSELTEVFESTFKYLAETLPEGITREKRNITPSVLFEAIAVGVADLISKKEKIDKAKTKKILNNEELKKLTTGATNSNLRLIQRINFVKKNIKK